MKIMVLYNKSCIDYLIKTPFMGFIIALFERDDLYKLIKVYIGQCKGGYTKKYNVNFTCMTAFFETNLLILLNVT